MILLKAEVATRENARQGGPADRDGLFLMSVFLASFHAFFHMVDGRVNGFDGGRTMSAFIVLGFFQMMLGLLQGFQRSLHLRPGGQHSLGLQK